MEIILQMRVNLGRINETLQQQTYEIRQQLGVVFDEQKLGLEKLQSEIDVKLRECAAALHDYQRLYQSLVAMRTKLVQLGGDPSPLPPSLEALPMEEVLLARLRQLRELGKL